MGGGLMQLVAYGAQDIYLTGNPEITFFKKIHKRHTNFSIESIQQVLNGEININRKASCILSRSGDLIHKMFLQMNIDFRLGSWKDTSGDTVVYRPYTISDNIGHNILDYIDLEIGGTIIDRQYGIWIEVWSELTITESKKTGYDLIIDGFKQVKGTNNKIKIKISDTEQATIGEGYPEDNKKSRYSNNIYIPLQFWFCKNPGLALPLIALQYHEIKVHFYFKSNINNQLCKKVQSPYTAVDHNDADITSEINPIFNIDASLWVDYIFLDTEERRKFAQVSHEYLIDQIQVIKYENTNLVNYSLSINHPVKELIWVINNKNEDWNVFTKITKATILLNGHERFAERDGDYFSIVQPYQYHSVIPCSGSNSKNINCYSFALNPEEHQPSGTCNFSRIDNAYLKTEFVNDSSNDYFITIFAVNYNILRINSGMGGLAYSN